ncbi:hypothetical protein P154DRAFT_407691, partial [Amniculicola lignicola CBS 123094]
APRLNRRDDFPDEVVVLADCDNGKTGTEFKIEDRMHYYTDDYARRSGREGSSDTVGQGKIHDPGMHDGTTYHVSWEAGTVADPVSATFPDEGRKFKVWGLPSAFTKGAVADEPVEGTADFDGAQFKCYRGDPALKWRAGIYNCRAAFTCTSVQREIHKTEVLFDENVQQVGEAKCHDSLPAPPDAKEAFKKLKEAVKTKWDTSKGHDIGGDCFIYYTRIDVPPSSPRYDAGTPEKIADIFIDYVGAAIEKNRTIVERNCPIPNPYGAPAYTHVKAESLSFPRAGSFEIFVAAQANPQWKSQTRVDFQVKCKSACNDGKQALGFLANGLALFGGWISPVFGTITAAINIVNFGLEAC